MKKFNIFWQFIFMIDLIVISSLAGYGFFWYLSNIYVLPRIYLGCLLSSSTMFFLMVFIFNLDKGVKK